ncbi:hypothetical protein J6590_046433 [Homalodisca vitripennis]|nr:hypothetical protein J6590_046433 [Homalodisca vitripennis]
MSAADMFLAVNARYGRNANYYRVRENGPYLKEQPSRQHLHGYQESRLLSHGLRDNVVDEAGEHHVEMVEVWPTVLENCLWISSHFAFRSKMVITEQNDFCMLQFARVSR